MKNIWMLTRANLRKNKGQAISITLVIMLATTLLSIGLVVLDDIGRFFDERADYLNAPHFVVAEERYTSNNDRLDFILNFDGVVATETQDVIVGLGGYHANEIINAGGTIFADGTVAKSMHPLSLIGDYLPLVGDAIYVPHFIFLSGFGLGDAITLDFLGTDLEFTVAGSTEDLLLGDMGPGNWRFYISHERYIELSEQFPHNQFTMLLAQMENQEDVVFLRAAYNSEFFGAEYTVQTFGGIPLPWAIGQARSSRLAMPSMLAGLLMGFSMIVLVVAVIVIRFRIVSSIEEGIINIGALKAIGYSSRQIVGSIVLQFGLLAVIGSLLGVGLSTVIMPLSAVVFEPMLSLVWLPSVDVLVALMPLLIFVLLVLLFAFASARRINKFHPLVALRGGLATHNFKKNYAPLDKGRGPLVFLLALKQLLQSKKQALAIMLIVTGLMMASVYGLATHYNVSVNTDGFIELFGGEFADVILMVDSEAGFEAVGRIADHPDVAVLQGAEFALTFTDEVLITTTVVEDFDTALQTTLTEGRLPQHDNEIVLADPALRVMDRSIGDWVTIRMGEIELEFLVVGMIQNMNHGGLAGMINFEAAVELQPDFAFSQFEIILNDGADVHEFIEEIRANESEYLTNIIAMMEQLYVSMESMGGVFALIAGIVLSVSTAVIVLVLYLIIKSIIRRRQRELGIQKALGFTTVQLMNQIAMSLMPTITISAVIGVVVGSMSFNSLFLLSMSGQGLVESNMLIPTLWVVIAGIATVLLAYLVSMLVAWRIRKISAYALVTE